MISTIRKKPTTQSINIDIFWKQSENKLCKGLSATTPSKKSLKIPKGGNQNPYIKEQTTQWPKENVQKDKQRSTKHRHKTKDWVTRTPLKTGGDLRFSGTESTFCSTSGTRRVNLVTEPVISHE